MDITQRLPRALLGPLGEGAGAGQAASEAAPPCQRGPGQEGGDADTAPMDATASPSPTLQPPPQPASAPELEPCSGSGGGSGGGSRGSVTKQLYVFRIQPGSGSMGALETAAGPQGSSRCGPAAGGGCSGSSGACGAAAAVVRVGAAVVGPEAWAAAGGGDEPRPPPCASAADMGAAEEWEPYIHPFGVLLDQELPQVGGGRGAGACLVYIQGVSGGCGISSIKPLNPEP